MGCGLGNGEKQTSSTSTFSKKEWGREQLPTHWRADFVSQQKALRADTSLVCLESNALLTSRAFKWSTNLSRNVPQIWNLFPEPPALGRRPDSAVLHWREKCTLHLPRNTFVYASISEVTRWKGTPHLGSGGPPPAAKLASQI